MALREPEFTYKPRVFDAKAQPGGHTDQRAARQCASTKVNVCGTIAVERFKEHAEQRLTCSTNMHGACVRRSRPIVRIDCGSPAAVSMFCELHVAPLSSPHRP